MSRIKVAVLAGGRSSEHDISKLSAVSVLDALDKDKYEPFSVMIERNGDWRLTSRAKLEIEGPASNTEVSLRQRAEVRPATVTNPTNALRGIDVIFPVLHGPFGEDGTIQGLLETANIPYVGNGVLASAVGLDKVIFKALLRDAGIKVAPEVVAIQNRTPIDEVVSKVSETLKFPVFVKPARLGSSIGISKVDKLEDLQAAIDTAFEYDVKVVIEQGIEGIEVECGILGNSDPIVSIPGEVVIGDDVDWYDFDSKYLDQATELHVPARIPEDVQNKVQDIALKVYQVLDCSGLARVDSFVTKDGDVIVNEINTMPGCTPTSAYAKLFTASGHSWNSVVDRLIDLAIDRHRESSKLKG